MNSRSETRARPSVAAPRAAGVRAGPSSLLTPAQARQLVRRTLTALGPVRASQVDDLLLVTSELVTNAHRHGGGVTSFGIAVGGDRVTVSVADSSGEPPRHEPREGLRPGGYGWPIVLRLCREVTVDTRPDGKTVHAAVAVHRRAEPDSGVHHQ